MSKCSYPQDVLSLSCTPADNSSPSTIHDFLSPQLSTQLSTQLYTQLHPTNGNNLTQKNITPPSPTPTTTTLSASSVTSSSTPTSSGRPGRRKRRSTIGGPQDRRWKQKMAMLGDAILRMAVLNDWYGTGESRKVAHDLNCNLGNNRNFAKCGKEAGLKMFINKNRSFLKGVIPQRTMAATVEALIGAVYVDSGESLRAVEVAMKGLGLIV